MGRTLLRPKDRRNPRAPKPNNPNINTTRLVLRTVFRDLLAPTPELGGCWPPLRHSPLKPPRSTTPQHFCAIGLWRIHYLSPSQPYRRKSWVTPVTSGTNIYTKHHRLSKFPSTSILSSTTVQLLIQRLYMIGLHDSLYSKNTPLRPPPLTTQITRRSSYRRLYGPCSHTTKTQGLWHAMNHINTQPPNRVHSIPFPYAFLMGIIITSSICLCQTDLKSLIAYSSPHGTCYCSYPHSNPLKLHRGYRPNNHPRPHIVYIILPSKTQITNESTAEL
eukprot:bmy_13335T0